MYFNNINLVTKYGVIVMDKGINTAEKEIFYDWSNNSLDPIKLQESKTKYATFNPKILVEDTNQTNLEIKISNILAECQSGILKYSDLNFSYDVELNNSSIKYINQNSCELMLEFQVNCKYSEEKTITKNSITQFVINNEGNTDTYCRLEITPTTSYIDLTIKGLTEEEFIIKNLQANKTIIIDRDYGIIVDNNNKFNDVENLWGFPKLLKGNNNVILSRNGINIKIIYKERFI